MKKVILTGVESTGKTVLAKSIAGHYECPMVEEYSRNYLKDKGLKYNRSDLITILQGQFDAEAEAVIANPDLIVCDTGPVVIKVWSLFKYGTVDPRIEHAVKSYRADLFILPDPTGVPFYDDPLRESPNHRKELFQMYMNELMDLEIPFLIANGTFENRLNQVRAAVAGVLA